MMAYDGDETIPPQQWRAFINDLNDTCRGLRARVETAAAGAAPRVVAADSPFAGIVDSEEGLVIELAGGLSYNAGPPQSISSAQSDNGPGQTVAFTTATGQRTTLLLAGGALLSRTMGAAQGDRLTSERLP
jgi:hypothetical protein